MDTRNRSIARKAAPAAARDAYISFNKDEWAGLQELGFRERWAYMQLKWLANFKTGMVGNFRKQRLTYQDIANLVTAPGVQGRGMGNIDDTQAADFVGRLTGVGLLVQHPNRGNGGLLFELPLSPINRQASALRTPVSMPQEQGRASEQISPDWGTPEPVFSPGGDTPPFDDIPMATGLSDVVDPSLSVLALTKLKNNTDAAGAASADAAPPSRATDAAADLENPRREASTGASLTARDIQAVIAGDWTFTQTDTPEAKMLYDSWAGAGITLDDLYAAMASLEGHDGSAELTPASLTPRLWPRVVDGWVGQLAACPSEMTSGPDRRAAFCQGIQIAR
ncbi:hypothetical protein [Ramlibacter sp.]|uniref:hypothetical protein n=1 Tax=Ramlibacter sp. TaxID=1917967 RepID=UPI0018596BF9|nr:hypothetical protein [Ramlibacter sp.]MBA2675553.1 hypothetical protein [Ramlibacter sp.]